MHKDMALRWPLYCWLKTKSIFLNLVRRALEVDGHQVVQAFTGPDGLRLAESTDIHLVILDWMLPGMDGLTVCRRLRETHLTPILMLTARGDEVDRVVGLEIGADEYLVKPVSLRELMARVRAMLRRVEMDSRAFRGNGASAPRPPPRPRPWSRPPRTAPAEPAIVIGDLRLLPAERQVSIAGTPVDLTPKEYELLKLMAAHPGRAFSREYLLESLWGYEYDGFDRTVDTHIQRLRKKLGPLGDRICDCLGSRVSLCS